MDERGDWKGAEMNGTDAYGRGHEYGWQDAGRFFASRKVRAAIRRRFARSSDLTSPWWTGYRDAFADRLEQRAGAIEQGLAPRTVSPRLLNYVLAGHDARLVEA
jgi:hypothetical protein